MIIKKLYNSIVKLNEQFYLPEWYLYLELCETENNIEPFDFYNWETINNEEEYNIIFMMKNDFKNNFDVIIDIVQNIVVDNIKHKNGYNYINNKVVLDWWVLDGLYQCTNCGNIWDGYAQCICYYDCDAGQLY